MGSDSNYEAFKKISYQKRTSIFYPIRFVIQLKQKLFSNNNLCFKNILTSLWDTQFMK